MPPDSSRPPRIPSALLSLLLPSEEEGAVLGDLREEHGRLVAERGRGPADLWYTRQVLASLLPTVRRRLWRWRRGFRGPATRIPSTRDTGRTSMADLIRDFRYALRGLLRSPTYLAVSILTLTLGIGASAAIWSVVDQTLLQPLPYEDEEALVRFWHPFSWTPEEILHMRGRWDGFEGVAAWTTYSSTFRTPGGPTSQVSALGASTELFDVLGVEAAQGRTFRAGEDDPGAAPVVVVSWDLWQSELGGRPDVLGSPVVVDGESRTVVGVMPEDFYFPDRTFRMWLPGPLDAEDRSGNWTLTGRLPDGRTIDGMSAELARITAVLGRAFQYDNPQWDRTRNPSLTPVREELLGDVDTALYLTLGAMALILAMACANVAALTVARTQSRTGELAVRSALGAGRARIGKQFLLEAVVLALLAGAAGAALAAATFGAVVSVLPVTEPLAEGLSLDWRVFGAASALALVTGLLVGLAPLVSILKDDLRSGLVSSRGQATGRGRLERFLVVADVALAVLLVTGAGLMLRSVERLQGVESGFEPEGLLAVQVTMGGIDFPLEERVLLWDRLRERVEAVPGVASADAIQVPPLWGAGWNYGLSLEGRDDLSVSTLYRIVTPGYFETTGIDIIEGRGFQESDVAAAEPVVVVNEAFVREFLPGGRVLGHRLTTGVDDRWATIVGVTEDAAETGIREPPGPLRYVLGRQIGFVPESAALLVRGRSADVSALAPSVRAAVRQLDPRIAVARVEPMTAAYRRELGRAGQLVLLLGGLGGLALLLGAVGVYGVLGHFAGRRTREWGVRLALGQEPGGVLARVLRQGMALVGLGVVLGLASSWAASRFVSALLYEVSEHDPLAFGGAAAVLLLVGLVAAALPAWRASRTDPVVSLKAE